MLRVIRPSSHSILGHRFPLGHTVCPLSTRSSSSASRDETEKDQLPPALLRLESARLRYQGFSTITPPLDLTIQHPSTGGHALLGPNASAKTLVSNALAASHSQDGYLHEGALVTDKNWRSHHVAHVSFESHEALLANGGSAYHAISFGSNKLNRAAQFLVVRFGLFPLLHRDVSTLSTGEIRKVLVVRALSRRPRLLILDNAFDGLDVPSRQSLAELVSKTLRGFRPDILVQGIDARATAHTQVLLLTHRPEEIVDEIETVSYLVGVPVQELVTESRGGRTGEELLSKALGLGIEHGLELDHSWEDPSLPTVNDVDSWWKRDRERSQSLDSPDKDTPLIEAKDLCVKRGEAMLLHNLNWKVQSGERWLVAGGNGAGKSSLSRMLAKDEGGIEEGTLSVSVGSEKINADHRRPGTGWVSTELHMALARSSRTMSDILNDAATSSDIAATICSWMGLDDRDIMSRPLSSLAQGEQKLVLLAASLASRPKLLVLDEPCQGLDWAHRQKVLGLVERICQGTDMSLVYITHHLEETIPSVGHVLHLQEGRAIYNGSRQEYDPRALTDELGR